MQKIKKRVIKDNRVRRHQKKQHKTNKMEQNHEKHKCLLHNKNAIIQWWKGHVIKKWKGKKIKQFSLWSWRWMGKEVQWNEKYIGTILLPLVRWPKTDPLEQKLRFSLAILALRFLWFQRHSVDFRKPVLFGKIQARHPKTQKWRWARSNK